MAVKAFNMASDPKIIAHLDSVFFSIDLDRGVIYNADSLPKGTDVSRLVPVITFANTMTKVELAFNKDNRTDTIVNYLTNPNDSIDFSEPVSLNVTAQDGTSTYHYTIKVNVHQQNPDSLIWSQTATAPFATRLPNPKALKAVEQDSEIVVIAEEADGSWSLIRINDIREPENSTAIEINPGFNPVIDTFTSTGLKLYILSENGCLFESADGITWTDTGEYWDTIIGSYLGSVIGLTQYDGGPQLYHTRHYPQNPAIEDSFVDNDFPILGRSNLGILDTGWSPNPIAIFAGGRKYDGSLSSDVWAFDGTTWTVISNINPPALEGACLMRYVVYKTDSRNQSSRAYDVWLLYGGKNEEGIVNNTLYLSADNGLTWTPASIFMQFPDDFPALYNASPFVISSRLNADLSDIWTTRSPATRASLDITIDGFDLSWNCPYIYLLGGYDSDGELSTSIWRAVLAKLTFTPEF